MLLEFEMFHGCAGDGRLADPSAFACVIASKWVSLADFNFPFTFVLISPCAPARLLFWHLRNSGSFFSRPQAGIDDALFN